MVISCSENDQKSVGDIDHDVYEMRVYYTYDGKFDDIITRFENHTTKLFEKHGFNNVGYWTTLKKDSLSFADKFIFQNNGKDALVYIVSFKDMDTRNEFVTICFNFSAYNFLYYSWNVLRWNFCSCVNNGNY